MEALLVVVGAIVVGLVVLAVAGYVVSSKVVSGNARKGQALLGPIGTEDHEGSAILAKGGTRGFGVLRLTPTQLLFANPTSGEVLAIAREQITSVTATTDLGVGEEEIVKPALMVTTGLPEAQVNTAFLVTDVQDWVARITGQHDGTAGS